MKTREFNINNYKVEDIIKNIIQKSVNEYIDAFTHPLMKEGSVQPVYSQMYKVLTFTYEELDKKTQKLVLAECKVMYEEKKAKTILEYTELKAKCDNIFYDDKNYAKFVPELEHLYYCQAYSALLDFYGKKIRSNAVSNSRYQARAMSYSTISCD